MSSRRVWYCLVDAEGNAFRSSSVDAVTIANDSLIVDLRAMIFSQNSNILCEFSPAQLSVYANREDCCSDHMRIYPLEADVVIHALGMTRDSSVYVGVPSESLRKRQRTAAVNYLFTTLICKDYLPNLREDGLEISGSVVNFVTLNAEWLMGSGIGKVIPDENENPKVVDTMLYMRKLCLEQIEFMAHLVQTKDGIGLINGQPGTGKSTTAYLTALMLAVYDEKIILWIHIGKSLHEETSFHCVVMRGTSLYSFPVMNRESVEDLIMSNWGEQDENLERVLFYDGFVRNSVTGGDITKVADTVKAWYESNFQRHVVFVLSPMGMATFLTKEARMYIREKRFTQWSWKKSDYRLALGNAEFRKSVADQLVPADAKRVLPNDRPHSTAKNSMAYLKAKYFYAGGCARYMFDFSTEQVIGELNLALIQQKDVSALTNTLKGCSGSDLSHTLMSVFGPEHRDIVSDYVKHCIAKKTDTVPLLDFARRFELNPAMCGWIFEEFFFNCIWTSRVGNLTLLSSKTSEKPLRLLKGSQMWYDFSPEDPTVDECPIGEWLRPRKFNQGGFDAVYLTFKTATFVQCTIAASHSVKLQFCKEFLDAAHSNNFLTTIERIKFYMVIPKSVEGIFSVSKISGQRHFPKLEIQVRAIEGWITD
jgi:hypothetical protein